MVKKAQLQRLLRELRRHYTTSGRSHLPWRSSTDPYRILVSEIMLQQTQVERVVPFYERFLKKFPSPKKLAGAPLSAVLLAWQGLGYNRRARYLQEAAKILAREGFTGQKLPGVGPYTAGAVLAFAFNKPEVFVETNIRTVFFHHFGVSRKMSDAELLPLVEEALKESKMEPRDFYAALMDYGSHLKRQGVRLNSRSKHYAKQSKFEGSARQLRGAILRSLLEAPAAAPALARRTGRPLVEIRSSLLRMEKENLIRRSGSRFLISG